MDEVKLVEIPEVGILYSRPNKFILYKESFDGKVILSKEEASLLLIELYKFIMNEK